MINFSDTNISVFATHFVGNKLRTEGVQLSEELSESSDSTNKYLLNYFLFPFKGVDFWSFNHNIDLEYNEIYSQCCKIFDSNKTFLKNSKNIAKHLYEHSLHPKIKAGELIVVLFENCIYEDEILNAVGIFKTETKDIFIKINTKEQHFVFKHELGININKLEKGCIILNTDREKGFKILVTDKSANEEAYYWKNEFLNLKSFQNDYTQTKAIVELTKSFVEKNIDKKSDRSKKEKIEILNKSLDYFQSETTYNEKKYVEKVFDTLPQAYSSFKEHKKNYSDNNNIEIANSFNVSDEAFKKTSKTLKSIIKLDKTIQIHINGNGNQIERGFDKATGKNYYKIYFEKES
jgi:hypothetical protein